MKTLKKRIVFRIRDDEFSTYSQMIGHLFTVRTWSQLMRRALAELYDAYIGNKDFAIKYAPPLLPPPAQEEEQCGAIQNGRTAVSQDGQEAANRPPGRLRQAKKAAAVKSSGKRGKKVDRRGRQG